MALAWLLTIGEQGAGSWVTLQGESQGSSAMTNPTLPLQCCALAANCDTVGAYTIAPNLWPCWGHLTLYYPTTVVLGPIWTNLVPNRNIIIFLKNSFLWPN